MAARGITSLSIRGYRPFRDFTARFGPLNVLVGANGSGKSALFEFLKFLRDSVYQDILPEIVAGAFGQEIFHIPGPERIGWSVDIDLGPDFHELRYEGQLDGPIGRTRVVFEHVTTAPTENAEPTHLLNVNSQMGYLSDPTWRYTQLEVKLTRPNQLALSTATNPNLPTLYALREYILRWRFYSAFRIANEKIRRPVPIEQEPVLHEDGGNLSAVLFFLMTEHRSDFDALEVALRTMIPGFKGLSVKARGRGEVLAFWREGGIDRELSLADLSDGILRLLCWGVLCVQPNPPSLICIDEPDQGVHPRTLPILAGLFQKASERSQVLLATHASYFLTQFPIDAIAILRKEDGAAAFARPSTSQVMREMLDEFGAEELERLHRSDELEQLS